MDILTAEETRLFTCVFSDGSAMGAGASEVAGRLLDALSRPLLGARGTAAGSGVATSAAGGASGAASGASTAAAGASSAATGVASASTGCSSSAIGTERRAIVNATSASALPPRPPHASCAGGSACATASS